MSWCLIEELCHTYAIGTYNEGQSGSSSVSNPSADESSSDRNSSYHALKAHISYVCICCEYSHLQCGRGKEKGLYWCPIKLELIMRISAALRESIAACRGFIGQQ